MRHFDYGPEGVLYAEQCDLQAIAAEVGTPTYVYARATVERHFAAFDSAFDAHPHLVCYAIKANPNQAIINLLARMGSGADIVSVGELQRALSAGIPADRIVFSGVGKTASEMAAALDAQILAFNVESEMELDALSAVARDKGATAPVALRVNPDVDPETHPYIATGLKDSKFGIPIRDARRLAKKIQDDPGLELNGIDCHIGSQLERLDPLLEALDSVLALVDELRAAGTIVEHIDIGGGLGIPYGDKTPPHPRELGAAVVARMKDRPERLVLEPGRVIVGNAGLLLTKVLYIKENPSKTFVVVDAAMNDLLRPSLYKAHHEIWPVRPRPDAPRGPVDVVGPICESGDYFAKDRVLRRPEPGDLMAVMSAGAYGFTMASNYNSRPLAAEVVVSGQNHFVVRQRQALSALFEDEHIPHWD